MSSSRKRERPPPRLSSSPHVKDVLGLGRTRRRFTSSRLAKRMRGGGRNAVEDWFENTFDPNKNGVNDWWATASKDIEKAFDPKKNGIEAAFQQFGGLTTAFFDKFGDDMRSKFSKEGFERIMKPLTDKFEGFGTDPLRTLTLLMDIGAMVPGLGNALLAFDAMTIAAEMMQGQMPDANRILVLAAAVIVKNTPKSWTGLESLPVRRFQRSLYLNNQNVAMRKLIGTGTDMLPGIVFKKIYKTSTGMPIASLAPPTVPMSLSARRAAAVLGAGQAVATTLLGGTYMKPDERIARRLTGVKSYLYEWKVTGLAFIRRHGDGPQGWGQYQQPIQRNDFQDTRGATREYEDVSPYSPYHYVDKRQGEWSGLRRHANRTEEELASIAVWFSAMAGLTPEEGVLALGMIVVRPSADLTSTLQKINRWKMGSTVSFAPPAFLQKIDDPPLPSARSAIEYAAWQAVFQGALTTGRGDDLMGVVDPTYYMDNLELAQRWETDVFSELPVMSEPPKKWEWTSDIMKRDTSRPPTDWWTIMDLYDQMKPVEDKRDQFVEALGASYQRVQIYEALVARYKADEAAKADRMAAHQAAERRAQRSATFNALLKAHPQEMPVLLDEMRGKAGWDEWNYTYKESRPQSDESWQDVTVDFLAEAPKLLAAQRQKDKEEEEARQAEEEEAWDGEDRDGEVRHRTVEDQRAEEAADRSRKEEAARAEAERARVAEQNRKSQEEIQAKAAAAEAYFNSDEYRDEQEAAASAFEQEQLALQQAAEEREQGVDTHGQDRYGSGRRVKRSEKKRPRGYAFS